VQLAPSGKLGEKFLKSIYQNCPPIFTRQSTLLTRSQNRGRGLEPKVGRNLSLKVGRGLAPDSDSRFGGQKPLMKNVRGTSKGAMSVSPAFSVQWVSNVFVRWLRECHFANSSRTRANEREL